MSSLHIAASGDRASRDVEAVVAARQLHAAKVAENGVVGEFGCSSVVVGVMYTGRSPSMAAAA